MSETPRQRLRRKPAARPAPAPTVDVSAPVTVDMGQLATVLGQLGESLAQIMRTQERIAGQLTALAERDQPAPVVNVPPGQPRPRAFQVTFDRTDDGVSGMRIEAESSH